MHTHLQMLNCIRKKKIEAYSEVNWKNINKMFPFSLYILSNLKISNALEKFQVQLSSPETQIFTFVFLKCFFKMYF